MIASVGPFPTRVVRGATVAQPPASIWWGPLSAGLVVLAWMASLAAGFQTSLLILTIMGFVALIAGLRFPAIGLLGITILCILDSPARVYLLTGGLLRWNTLNYWLLIMMAWYLPFLIRLRDPHSIALLVFIALLLLELIISPGIGNGMQNVLNIGVVFGLLIYFIRAGEDRRMWFWLALNGGLIGALGGAIFYRTRIQLPYINENAWAAFPLTALIAVMLGFPSAAALKRGQPTLMVLAAANLAWIFLSGSRGTLLIGFCCFIALLLGMRGVRQRTIALVAGAIMVATVATSFSDLQARTIHRITRLFTPEHALVGNYSLGSRTSGRSDLAIGGWYILQEHPFGVGTGGFPTAWSKLGHHYGLVYGRGEEKQAHSGWVKTMVENGIPGLTLLVIYIFSFAAVGLRQRSWSLWRLGILTTLALTAALLGSEFQTKGLWFLAAGATAFLHRERLTAALYGRDDDLMKRDRALPRSFARREAP